MSPLYDLASYQSPEYLEREHSRACMDLSQLDTLFVFQAMYREMRDWETRSSGTRLGVTVSSLCLC